MKKRVMLTLESEPYDELKRLSKSMGLPASSISYFCDQAIQQTIKMLKLAESKGKLSITDLLMMVGQAIEEETANDEKRQETPKKGKRN